MKKVLAIMITVAMLAFTGTAFACGEQGEPACPAGGVDKTWTDAIGPVNIFFTSGSNPYSFTFDITDPASGSFVAGEDWVNSYIINLDFADDNDNAFEKATITVDGITYDSKSSKYFDMCQWSWVYTIKDKQIKVNGNTLLNATGTLTTTITRTDGDFYFKGANLTATGCDFTTTTPNPPTSAPEPTSLLLFGLGLLGLAGIRRKIKK